MLPPSNILLHTYQDLASIMKEIGMNYEPIHACPDDHVIYYNQHEFAIECPECHVSRYHIDKVTKGKFGCPVCGPKIKGFFFKVRPFFLHISKCRTIYRNLNNIILTYVPSMVIHKLCYVIAPEQLLQRWNDGNITKNLLRHLFCYFICTISTYMTFWTFCYKFMLIIIYNMVIGTCMNCFIMHSNLFHDGR